MPLYFILINRYIVYVVIRHSRAIINCLCSQVPYLLDVLLSHVAVFPEGMLLKIIVMISFCSINMKSLSIVTPSSSNLGKFIVFHL